MTPSLPLLAGLLSALLADASAVAQAPAAAARAAAVQLSASVLRIEAQRLRGGFSLGSGVMVAPELVVTNCHVTRQSATLYVVRAGARWTVTAQRADTDHDLCLLQAPGVQATVASLADVDELSIGQEVTALGYTGGMELQLSAGTVVDLHLLDGGRVVQTSNGFNSGASGGGLFDVQSQLVGILTFRLRGGEQHYFAAPAIWVRKLVAQAQADGLQPVAPLDPTELPFWQWQGARQPRFLRAGVLVSAQQWDDLAGLARDWLHDDVQDSEPWYLLGLALGRLDQSAAARAALDCAFRLQPRRPLAARPAQEFVHESDEGTAAASSLADNHDVKPAAKPAGRLAGTPSCPAAA